MEAEQQIRPATLNYASKQNPARLGRPLRLVGPAAMLITFFVLVATFTIPSFNHNHTGCRTDLTRANMGGLTAPLELYRQAAGSYPTFLDDLHRPPLGLAKGIWGGPYIDSPDKLRDAWGRRLRYESPGVKNPQRYDLWSAGEDGIDGTTDDVKNW